MRNFSLPKLKFHPPPPNSRPPPPAPRLTNPPSRYLAQPHLQNHSQFPSSAPPANFFFRSQFPTPRRQNLPVQPHQPLSTPTPANLLLGHPQLTLPIPPSQIPPLRNPLFRIPPSRIPPHIPPFRIPPSRIPPHIPPFQIPLLRPPFPIQTQPPLPQLVPLPTLLTQPPQPNGASREIFSSSLLEETRNLPANPSPFPELLSKKRPRPSQPRRSPGSPRPRDFPSYSPPRKRAKIILDLDAVRQKVQSWPSVRTFAINSSLSGCVGAIDMEDEAQINIRILKTESGWQGTSAIGKTVTYEAMYDELTAENITDFVRQSKKFRPCPHFRIDNETRRSGVFDFHQGRPDTVPCTLEIRSQYAVTRIKVVRKSPEWHHAKSLQCDGKVMFGTGPCNHCRSAKRRLQECILQSCKATRVQSSTAQGRHRNPVSEKIDQLYDEGEMQNTDYEAQMKEQLKNSTREPQGRRWDDEIALRQALAVACFGRKAYETAYPPTGERRGERCGGIPIGPSRVPTGVRRRRGIPRGPSWPTIQRIVRRVRPRPGFTDVPLACLAYELQQRGWEYAFVTFENDGVTPKLGEEKHGNETFGTVVIDETLQEDEDEMEKLLNELFRTHSANPAEISRQGSRLLNTQEERSQNLNTRLLVRQLMGSPATEIHQIFAVLCRMMPSNQRLDPEDRNQSWRMDKIRIPLWWVPLDRKAGRDFHGLFGRCQNRLLRYFRENRREFPKLKFILPDGWVMDAESGFGGMCTKYGSQSQDLHDNSERPYFLEFSSRNTLSVLHVFVCIDHQHCIKHRRNDLHLRKDPNRFLHVPVFDAVGSIRYLPASWRVLEQLVEFERLNGFKISRLERDNVYLVDSSMKMRVGLASAIFKEPTIEGLRRMREKFVLRNEAAPHSQLPTGVRSLSAEISLEEIDGTIAYLQLMGQITNLETVKAPIHTQNRFGQIEDLIEMILRWKADVPSERFLNSTSFTGMMMNLRSIRPRWEQRIRILKVLTRNEPAMKKQISEKKYGILSLKYERTSDDDESFFGVIRGMRSGSNHHPTIRDYYVRFPFALLGIWRKRSRHRGSYNGLRTIQLSPGWNKILMEMIAKVQKRENDLRFRAREKMNIPIPWFAPPEWSRDQGIQGVLTRKLGSYLRCEIRKAERSPEKFGMLKTFILNAMANEREDRKLLSLKPGFLDFFTRVYLRLKGNISPPILGPHRQMAEGWLARRVMQEFGMDFMRAVFSKCGSRIISNCDVILVRSLWHRVITKLVRSFFKEEIGTNGIRTPCVGGMSFRNTRVNSSRRK